MQSYMGKPRKQITHYLPKMQEPLLEYTQEGIIKVKYIELFCGIGGFRYGLEACNREQQKDAEISRCGNSVSDKIKQSDESEKWRNYTCVWANDIDKYASAIYRYHWNDGTLYEGDIRTMDVNSIPEHDLIVGGFPCQSFSIAGKRGGFQDTRGTLFFEICRIAKAKGTKFLFLENVRGLLSHDKGNTFQTIIATLDELGYDCQWQVFNSKYHAVPQNRERVFIIANLRTQPRPQVFPLGENAEGINERADETTSVRTIQGGGHSGGHHSGMTLLFVGGVMGDKNSMWLEDGKENSRNFPQGQRVYSPEGISAQLTAQGGEGWDAKTGLYDVTPMTRTRSNQEYKNNEISPPVRTTDKAEVRIVQIPQVAQALQVDGQLRSGTSWGTDKPQSSRNIRRLTPIEYERLQGFPDNWTKNGIDKNGKQIPISDSQRYKCCGNAVTTNVITDIGNQLIKSLGGF